MKVYVKEHSFGAGKWIYKGYKDAWSALGYDARFYTDFSEIDRDDEYDLMAIDADVKDDNIDTVMKARRSYVYTQPNKFPLPWGSHPNFVSLCPDHIIERLNKLDNVRQWCFGEVTDNHHKWRNVNYIPLAFDSINYNPVEDERYKFDVCYIGGWANNGFNEKRKIMIAHFSEIKKLDLKCGIFINRGVSLQQEADILFNSKIAINIHDAYQREMGCDVNERTFKALGLNGFLISDDIGALDRWFDDLPRAKTAEDMAMLIKEYVNQDLTEIKERNRRVVLDKHTYTHRVEELLSL